MITLSGLMAFLPTPFTDDDQLDTAAVERQVEFLVQGGVDSVVVAGGVGEFYALTSDEHRELVVTAVGAASGRLPVIAGVGHSTTMAAELAGRAARSGASALMVNPLYFVRPELRGLIEHYRALGAAADLGLIVFSTRGARYGPNELEALAQVPQVAAVKDEVGDLDAFTRCRERLGNRYTWINGMAEPMAMEYAAAGAQAMTSGLANLDPLLSSEIWAAALAGDQARYDELMRRAEPILSLRRSRPGLHTTVLKEGTAWLGRTTPFVRLPLVPLDESDRLALVDMMSGLAAPAVG